jgi:hypothetical protein
MRAESQVVPKRLDPDNMAMLEEERPDVTFDV